ncbi:MAG: group II intron reverse transcriptase domain-containing protein [Bacteroidales bacterium]|nr:group II intron reverse transcriptase domain-containing protein [Bacteroidales bacterium]
MRRINGLYNQLCSFEHLLYAYKKAKKGTNTLESLAFMMNLENELLLLLDELKTETYRPQAYHYFTIHDPKEREISVAPFRDRVVHHAVVALLEPVFEKLFIHHSYATRKNKGTHEAVKTAQKMLRNKHWYLKADVKKYFYSIKQPIMIQLIEKRIKDRPFLKLIERIIYNTGEKSGLPIGNLTSQFFANIYLHELDNFILRQLKPAAYIRYMDDFVLFSDNKEELKHFLPLIEHFLDENLNLQLKQKAVLINNAQHGLSFLGTRIFRNTIRLQKQNLRRSLKRLRYKYYLYKNGQLDEKLFLASANSIIAHISAYNTYNLRKKIKFWHE